MEEERLASASAAAEGPEEVVEGQGSGVLEESANCFLINSTPNILCSMAY